MANMGEFHVNSNIKKRKYPHSTSRFYLSALTALLSVILALLLLQDSILSLYYFVSTLLMTIITFILRTRLFSAGTPKHSEKELFETEKSDSTFGMLILMLFALLAFVVIPILLVRVLDPYTWFILIISLTSGVSIAEVLFYLNIKRSGLKVMRRLKMRRSMWVLFLLGASSLNYASVSLLVIVWRLDIFYYLPMVFIISCMIGALVVDITKSIIYTYTCMIIGYMITIATFLLPYVIFAESVERINLAIIAVLNTIVKVFFISAIVYFLGAIVGCFLGEKSLEQTQI